MIVIDNQLIEQAKVNVSNYLTRPLTAETPVRNRLGLPKISVAYDVRHFHFLNRDPVFWKTSKYLTRLNFCKSVYVAISQPQII